MMHLNLKNRLLKEAVIIFIMLAGISLFLVSCDKEEDQEVFLTLNVRVTYPDYFSESNVEGAEVKLTNTVTNSTVSSTTNSSGSATFGEMIPGNYNISVSKTVSAEEASRLTPYNEEIFLNGALNNAVANETNTSFDVRLKGSQVGGLVFKQIYYTGSKTPAGGNYFSDQFFEIYNNSQDVIYVDSLCIGDTGGSPGNNLNAKPFGFQGDDDYVYLQNVWMVPGDGKSHPLNPGESFIIAQDGIDHANDSLGNPLSFDLGPGVADFETYVVRDDNRDIDNPDVPNMLPIHLGAVGFDWLVSVFGGSMVIFKHPDPFSLNKPTEPGATSSREYVQVPVEYVHDAVDIVASEAAVGFKRLPVSLDAGYMYASGTYTSEAIMRKVSKTVNGVRVLQDTNNSSEDFELIPVPKPKGW